MTKTVDVIPGPYSIIDSSFIELNGDNGCLTFEICQSKLDLRDKYGNLVSEPNVLEVQNADFQFEGPLED